MWVDNVELFLFTLTSPHSHCGSTIDGVTREEADKLTSPLNQIVDAFTTTKFLMEVGIAIASNQRAWLIVI